MTEQYPLYTVLDVGTDGILDGQHVEVFTVLNLAEQQRDDLVKMAADNNDSEAQYRVYQLVEPGLTLLPALEELPMPEQRVRLEAARLAVEHYRDADCEDAELVGTAAALGAYVADGTVPAGEDEPSVPDIVVRRTNSGPRTVEVLVDGEVVARTDYDEGGWSGMDAVERAAVGIAAALDCPVRMEEPEA
jgi:hypothetical protein